jgi:drug/metabolite transporter (DMT)-like permease
MTEKNKGILYIVIATMFFSIGGVVIKSVSAGALTITTIRAATAGLIFLPFIKWRSVRFDKNLVLLVLSYGVLTFCFVNATKMTTAADAIILQCTAPLWLYLFYLISGRKKLVKSECIPRLAILAGILIILFDPTNLGKGGDQAMLGNLLALGSGIAYAAEQYFMEKEYGISDKSIIGIANFFLVVVMLVCFHSQMDFVSLSLQDWGLIAMLGVFQLGIAYSFFFKGVRWVSAFEASIISLLEPILNPILVFLFVGEQPSLYTIGGYAAIFAGIILTLLPSKSRDKNTTSELEEEVCTKLSKKNS